MAPPPRQPIRDSIKGDAIQDWHEVQLGPGQVPGIYGPGDWQWTQDGERMYAEDIRRTPGRDHAYVVHRPPDNPV